jgi:GAF domain-containing protein
MPKNKDQEKATQANIQKRVESLFTDQELPAPESIRQVQALKTRIAELEATLEKQRPAEATPTLTPAKSTVSPLEPSDPTGPISKERPLEPQQSKDGFFSNLFRAPKFGNPAKDRIAGLQHTILLGLLFAALLGIGVSLAFWNDTAINGFGILTFTVILSGAALYWQRRGFLELVSWVVVITVYLVFMLSFILTGFTFPSAFVLTLVIVVAGLLLRYYGVIAVTVFAIVTLWVFPNIVDLPSLIKPNELLYTSVIIGFAGLLLSVASRTLEKSFADIDQSTEALTKTNRELQNFTENLETRVAERTRDLQLAAEIGRTSAEKVTHRDEMLRTAAEMIYTRFSGYYVQIYLTDPDSRSVVLHAGAGAGGEKLLQQGHRLMINSGSLNGRAVLEKKPVIVTDTTQSANFMPNPLLPNIHSEMAMPLIAGEQVIGTLDIQSEQVGGINETHLPAFEAVAGQLAIAIQNATLFAEAQQARTEVEAQIHRLAREGWQEFLDAIERGQRIGYAFDQTDIVSLDTATLLTTPAGAMQVPISVTGTQIGQIQLMPESGRTWTADETELAQSTAAQLAQHVDNLRLLALSNRYQAEAEQAVRRLTHEGWMDFKEQIGETEFGFVYDQNEVKLLVQPGRGAPVCTPDAPDAPDAPGVDTQVHPYAINARGETIAEFGIMGATPLSDEDAELVAIVGERLSAQLENLRLAQQTEQALSETEDLYQGSEKIVKAVTISEVLAAFVESTTLGQLERASLSIFDHPWDPQNPPDGITMVSSWIGGNQRATVPVGTHHRLVELPATKFLALNEIMVFSDITIDPRVDELTRKYFVETVKVKSVMTLPLVVDGRSIGGILAHSSHVAMISEAEIRKISSLLSQVATVIQSKRLFEQVQEQAKREQALRQITSAVRGSTDPATIMRTAVRELGNVLGRKTIIRMTTAEAQPAEDHANGSEQPAGTPGGEK